MLDYLNVWRLTPNLAYTIEENQSRASTQARKMVVDMNHDEIYVLLKMMQAVTGTVSAIVAENKQTSEVKLRREAFDAEREKRSKDLVADAEDTRLSQQAQIGEEKE